MTKGNYKLTQWGNKNTSQKKWVIYTRTATQKEATANNSLENQDRLCKEWAKYNNVKVVEVFSDPWVSWLSPQKEWLDQMINFLHRKNKRNKRISFVLVSDTSRISRDGLECIDIEQRIESVGAKIRSTDCGRRTKADTERGKVLFNNWQENEWNKRNKYSK